MFRQILQGPAKAPLLAQAFAETDEMLKMNERMFDAVTVAFFEGTKPELDIEYLDDDVNVAERMVRRAVFQHLTINPQKDLTASLVLLSVVHDAERVGDYVKALLRMLMLLDFPVPPESYQEGFRGVSDSIRPLFEETRIAFVDGDSERATEIVSAHTRIRTASWDIMRMMVKDDSLDRMQVILITSAARILRRVSAHLSNIATSVVQPFDKIGYTDEDA